MTNIIDYLAWRGDLSFAQSGLCAVDFLIFAQLVHAPLERLNGADHQTLSQMLQTVYPAAPEKDENILVRSRYELWLAAARTRRYADVTLLRFSSHFEPEMQKQFAAAQFMAGDATVVSFRGTDATLVGWKEDFNMAFESPVPSQTEAVAFLSEAARGAKSLCVCGHSKGGNLAMYSAAMCAPQMRAIISDVYSFDGPGLDEGTLQTEGYRDISPRICSFIPESSIIGLLMGYHEDYTIIRSDSVSLGQHNPYHWHVLGREFVTVDSTTRSSRFADRTLHAFLAECSAEERRALVDTLFNILNVSGARALRDIPRGIATHMEDVLLAVKGVSPATRQALGKTFRALADAGVDNLGILLGEGKEPTAQ